jgi:sterol O-acyltransferase
MIITEDIIPLVKTNLNVSIFELYLKLQMSIIAMIMLTIFLLFESMPNAVSELTLYADREFYQDWWNATSVEEFYGKWLRFTYLFFYRHVYMKFLIKGRFSPNTAKAISNLISGAFQELVVVRIII